MGRQGFPHRPSDRAWLLAAGLGLLAALLIAAAQVGRPIPPWHWPLAVVFLAVFTIAELVTFRVEARRQTVLLSLVEAPLVVGLYYLSPLLLVGVRTLSALVVMAYRGQSRIKLWFNVALVAAAAALAGVIIRAGVPLDGLEPTTWLLLVAAVFASDLLTLATVVGVVTIMQGEMSSRELARIMVPGLPVHALNILIGLVVLVLLQQGPWALVLMAAIAAFITVAYRGYAQSLQHSRALNEMYGLTRAVTSAPHDGTLPDVLLGRVRELLQSEYATLWIPARGRYPEVLLSSRVDFDALLDLSVTPPGLRSRAFQTGETVAAGPRLGDEASRAELRDSGQKDVIVVPLRAGSVVIGCLEVANRLGDTASFGPEDAKLLETIAGHVAVAVENSRLVDRLRYDAYHDALTGLPNRRRVSDALEESVAARLPDEVVTVLLVDVVGFRAVNELLGRAAGDDLLIEVGRRLRELAPSAALVGRVGNDEFVVMLTMPSAEAATELGAALRQQLRRQVRIGAVTLGLDVAVGVALGPDHGTEASVLLQRADMAARAAQNLPAGVRLFDRSIESRPAQRLGLAADLRAALDEGAITVYYQPKVAIADRRLVGVECLARWDHPGHGPVAPTDFVALAEHTGLVDRLTETVLDESLRRARGWRDTGHPLPVAVNVSARSLADEDFPHRVRDLLAKHDVPPELLVLEITEEGLAGGLERSLPVLQRLAEDGIRLAVDDFGTGSCSLSNLRRLPVREVKIDKGFVQGMATDPDDLAMVRAVVDTARHFGLDVVAEGVESELTLELLAGIGCHVGQGFLFSRPLPYERLEAWFSARTEAASGAAGVRKLRAVG